MKKMGSEALSGLMNVVPAAFVAVHFFDGKRRIRGLGSLLQCFGQRMNEGVGEKVLKEKAIIGEACRAQQCSRQEWV